MTDPRRIALAVVAAVALAAWIAAGLVTTMTDDGRHAECVAAGQTYADEFGWDPPDGIDQWCRDNIAPP